MPLQLHYIDEIIAARKALHGGGRGAPRLLASNAGSQQAERVGAALNRSCIVLLSAVLQSFVEDVFKAEARHRYQRLNTDPLFETYWKQMKMWGNPSDENVTALFLRIGIPDVFAGLSWQRTPTAAIKKKLRHLNQIRNGIAHGNAHLRVDNANYSLTMAKIENFRNFAEAFGDRFEAHVQGFR
ncbi:HEPN domain-containing protein [Ancylobacter sp. MQZ15Z-1]|uniref:HEPN domain-containing protein n=1 Tax=Ancylobacter mangrovi TaxID=2972472 RepID=A0A9X2T435_9HYPH|nr:HEPN domain-containing protein [Ancylobacter mangrovi]MCS0495591.1 HEPN domain-containing protein [Ancylobacter mangrovi]